MKNLLKQFDLKGEVVDFKTYGNGHINKTFLVKTTEDAYIFQFVNSAVFPDVDMLMNNIDLVTSHLRAKGKKTLEIVHTKDGKLYLTVGEDFFRGYRFIENSVCYEKLPSLDMVREAARGFGAFHKDLADVDVSKIGDVIPDFHDTAKRFASFEEIIKKNPKRRLAIAEESVRFVESRKDDYSLLVGALSRGEIRPSITHNDPKINNVAFDRDTGKVSCVLDLDTVMTGTLLYDFGDALRSLFTGDNEDSLDLTCLKADLAIYEAYLDGYFSEAHNVMNQREIELLPYSILVITEELAMRFLGDFVNGDLYFRADYPTHNLVRAQTQIALAKDIIARMDDLKAITAKIVKKYNNQ